MIPEIVDIECYNRYKHCKKTQKHPRLLSKKALPVLQVCLISHGSKLKAPIYAEVLASE